MHYRNIKLLFLVPLTFSAFANAANFADVKLTHIQPAESQGRWNKVSQFTPRYPESLAVKGVVGCGVFKVSINEDGETHDVELVSSVPRRVIAKPATRMIKNWKWEKTPGQAQGSEERLIRLDFCMGGNTQEQAKQRCEAQSRLQCSS